MHRRRFLGGLLTGLAAPSIIRTSGMIMPIKPLVISSSGLVTRVSLISVGSGYTTPPLSFSASAELAVTARAFFGPDFVTQRTSSHQHQMLALVPDYEAKKDGVLV